MDLDTEVAAFRDRSLAGQPFPYVFLDATYCKARVNHRVVSQAVVVATGVASRAAPTDIPRTRRHSAAHPGTHAKNRDENIS